MAIYHLSVKTISRSAGRSATAAIAYRAGETIACERTGLVHDYSRRRGVEHAEIFTPDNSPQWSSNRSELWNAAELSEKRKNSTVAREFEVALPNELSSDKRLELVREFSRELVQRHGMAVDAAIHAPDMKSDTRNYHAHILCSTRRLTPEGFKDKTRELDTKNSGEVIHWRERWADLSNHYLKQSGRDERIDHRTLEAQRAEAIEQGDKQKAIQLERVPTVHLGPNVLQMEQRGIKTERGDIGRDIQKRNAQIINLAEMRDRIDEVRGKHESGHNERDGRDRENARGSGGRTTRADGGAREHGNANESDTRQRGRIPPPIARDRLRNLSELSVVRFPERSEMLLPRDVSRDMEYERAERHHTVRRPDNELTPRQQIQHYLNDKLLESAATLKAESKPISKTDPIQVKREWQAEKDRQFKAIATKAKVIHAKAVNAFDAHDKKLKEHDRQRPEAPKGLFAGFKQAAHEKVISTWQGVKTGLERRWLQLQSRVDLISGYMRKAGTYEQPTRGERLAEKKAADLRPELASQFKDVIENEKAAKVAEQREKNQRKREGRMKQETNEELKQRIDANREKADAKEIKQLEKAGREAGMLNENNPEQEYDINRTGALQADSLANYLNRDQAKEENKEKSKEDKKREILDKFKKKVERDRSDERTRGH